MMIGMVSGDFGHSLKSGRLGSRRLVRVHPGSLKRISNFLSLRGKPLGLVISNSTLRRVLESSISPYRAFQLSIVTHCCITACCRSACLLIARRVRNPTTVAPSAANTTAQLGQVSGETALYQMSSTLGFSEHVEYQSLKPKNSSYGKTAECPCAVFIQPSPRVRAPVRRGAGSRGQRACAGETPAAQGSRPSALTAEDAEDTGKIHPKQIIYHVNRNRENCRTKPQCC